MNLAARLVDVAVPGEVLVPATMHDDASLLFRFKPPGRRLLKGIDSSVALASLTLITIGPSYSMR